METSEELEWELYDIFISGIFAFPVYEHNAARRIVRYLLMRGVLDEEIASAIEGPTVDLRIWLNRGGKHLVGEWVIAWLNDSRDQYRTRRRISRLKTRGRARLQDRKFFYRNRDDALERESFSVQHYLRSSEPHRSSFSSDGNDSHWTKEGESDISSDCDLEEEQEEEHYQEAEEPHLVHGSNSDKEQKKLDLNSQHLIRVDKVTHSVPRYKQHRPQTLTLDTPTLGPEAMSLMHIPPCAVDAPDSGNFSDTPCSCLLPCLDPLSAEDDCDLHTSASPDIVLEAEEIIQLSGFCPNCSCTLPHYIKIFNEAHPMLNDTRPYYAYEGLQFHKAVIV